MESSSLLPCSFGDEEIIGRVLHRGLIGWGPIDCEPGSHVLFAPAVWFILLVEPFILL